MSKITRLERQRFSILTNDLTRCYLCGKPKNHIHEIYFGKNRVNSMKWGCCVPLCYSCHNGSNGVHHNEQLNIMLKKKCRKKFDEVYHEIDFVSIFHQTYN